MILEVGPPRVEVPLQRSRSQSQGGHSKVSWETISATSMGIADWQRSIKTMQQESIPRPTYVKKRRPSLLGQLIAPLTPNSMRKREDEKWGGLNPLPFCSQMVLVAWIFLLRVVLYIYRHSRVEPWRGLEDQCWSSFALSLSFRMYWMGEGIYVDDV